MAHDGRQRTGIAVLVAALLPVAVMAAGHADVAQQRHAGKPVIRSISPRTGSTAGGTAVTIKGRHLHGVTAVRFGHSAPAIGTLTGPHRLIVLAPPHAAGQVTVQVVARGRRSSAQTFTYTDPAVPPAGPPSVTRLVPSIGSYGEQVVVVGDGFTPASTVTFGSERAGVQGWTPTTLTVQAPLNDLGPAQVRVTTPNGSSAPGAASVFTYRPWCTPIEVSTVSPYQGVSAGGTRVDLWGGPFDDVGGVTFDGVPGNDIVVLERGHLQVTTPAHSYGWVDVRVSTRCGESASGDERARFRFTPPPPTVTSISPRQASMAGARVTITGTNFEEVTGVDFIDGAGTDLVVISPTQLQVTAPPNSPIDGNRTVPVSVLTSGGSSPSGPTSRFTWVAPPSVWGVYPPYSPVTGGSRVLVEGSGFTGLGGVASVDFGEAAGTDVVVDSDAQLHVTAPPHLDGIVHVRVTTPAGTSRTSWDTRFSFDTPVEPAGTSAVPAPLPGGSTASSSISDVACPAPGECFAVGSYQISDDESRPLVERLSGGTWTPTALPLPSDAVHPPDFYQGAALREITCPAVQLCVAVGGYDNHEMVSAPFLASWDGVAWTVATVPMEEAYNGDDWVTFHGLDCTSDGSCVAVGTTEGGYQDIVVAFSHGAWAIAPSPVPDGYGAALLGVDCGTTDCVAVGRMRDAGFRTTPLVERGSGLSWTMRRPPVPGDGDGRGALADVSCPAAGSCVAVGSYPSLDNDKPLVETLAAGTWTPTSAPQPSVNLPDAYSFFTDVSCPTSSSCVAVGKYEDLVRDGYDVDYPILPMVSFLGPGPASTVQVPIPNVDPVHPEAGLGVVLCSAPGRCVGMGGYNQLGYRSRGLVANVTSGQVSGAPVRTPFQDGESIAHGITLDSATTAVLVGQYDDEQGHGHGLLVTGVAVGP